MRVTLSEPRAVARHLMRYTRSPQPAPEPRALSDAAWYPSLSAPLRRALWVGGERGEKTREEDPPMGDCVLSSHTSTCFVPDEILVGRWHYFRHCGAKTCASVRRTKCNPRRDNQKHGSVAQKKNLLHARAGRETAGSSTKQRPASNSLADQVPWSLVELQQRFRNSRPPNIGPRRIGIHWFCLLPHDALMQAHLYRCAAVVIRCADESRRPEHSAVAAAVPHHETSRHQW